MNTIRIRVLRDEPLRGDGAFVLYWMVAARRTRWSFALDRAIALARDLGRPLVVLEALRVAYPYASDRLHRFVLDGMADNAARFAAAGIAYHPYVEPRDGDGRGLLATLASRACAVVTDDFPHFFLPRMLAAAIPQVPCRFEAIDGNGILPLAITDRRFPTAYAFRRFVQQRLPAWVADGPTPDPLAGPMPPSLPFPPALPAGLPSGLPAGLPPDLLDRWPASDLRPDLARLPIDHAVPPAPLRGGEQSARDALARFVAGPLDRYADDRNHPDLEAASGLSPYLHFGHVSAHEVLHAVAPAWSSSPADRRPDGRRDGWWGLDPSREAFLDQLVTWRELGFGNAARDPDAGRFDGLPAWARATLAAHAADPRPHLYSLDDLESARTHDPLWNAAQRQLLREGRIHNYLRMLWGKKILEWSPSPREAFDRLLHLNDRHALDGRDPNSASGIAWCLGRYDRPWGPERPIFGTVRYMASANTLRKVRCRKYLECHGH